MKWSSYTKAALWAGAIFLAIDVTSAIALAICNYHAHHCTYVLARGSYPAHPIANALYMIVARSLFDIEARFVHSWSPSMLELAFYQGLLFLEAFLWGALLGIFTKALASLLTRSLTTA